MKMNTRFLVQAAVIAALYSALVIAGTFTPVGFLMFGPIQIRIAEALTILPFFTPAAVPGLFAGCLVSNIVGTAFAPQFAILGWWDVPFGSLATLAAAAASRALRSHKWLVPLPPVLINAIVVGLEFTVSPIGTPFWLNFLTIGAGEVAACYVLGMPLLYALDRRRRIFE